MLLLGRGGSYVPCHGETLTIERSNRLFDPHTSSVYVVGDRHAMTRAGPRYHMQCFALRPAFAASVAVGGTKNFTKSPTAYVIFHLPFAFFMRATRLRCHR